MADHPLFLPRSVLAHLCKRVDGRNPHLCKPNSTFPRMTAGPVSSILESVQDSRAIHGFVRKGRDHDQTSSYTVAKGPRSGYPLQLLRRLAPGRAQFESGLAIGVSEDAGFGWRIRPVSSLPPEPQCPAHRGACKRSHVKPPLAFRTLDGPAPLPPNTVFHREGKHQETGLVAPSLAVRANGRRDDL
jgi:hypothetical protein